MKRFDNYFFLRFFASIIFLDRPLIFYYINIYKYILMNCVQRGEQNSWKTKSLSTTDEN